jgi:hypothetical protein
MPGRSGRRAGRLPWSRRAGLPGGGGCSGRGAQTGHVGAVRLRERPRIGRTATILFCLWLAWPGFRVVFTLLDKSQPRSWPPPASRCAAWGRLTTCLLTDNEKTVTVKHVAGVPVRYLGAVASGGHYGLTVATCLPAGQGRQGGHRPDRDGRPGAGRGEPTGRRAPLADAGGP